LDKVTGSGGVLVSLFSHGGTSKSLSAFRHFTLPTINTNLD